MDINKQAKYLTGKSLDDGWIVKENISKAQDQNAKNFAETYLVEKDGKPAILKALDFSIALLDSDPPKALIQLSKGYDFEKELLGLCKSKNLSKIIQILAQGNIPPIP